MRKLLAVIFTFVISLTLCLTASPQTETAAAQPDVLPADSLQQRGDSTARRTLDSISRRMPFGPKSTPVDVDDEKPRVVMHYYDQHGEPLDEPVMFLATLDTVQKVKSKPVYPAYNGVNVGLNFGDLIFMAFGNRYASFDVWANVSLWNWIFPTVELGLGYADDTPDNQNFTYKVDPSFYAKVGLDYNFLYKSNPDYRAFIGLRAGMSSFNYALTDVTINSTYWEETQHLSLTGLKSTNYYGELLGGVQVKIVGGFSLGWTVRWHMKFNNPDDRGSRAWYIPGYGGSSPFSMTVSAIWTIPAKSRQPQEQPEP